MNDKGHFIISLIKSILRILACVIGLIYMDMIIFIIGIGTAEILGVVEELVDKRK